MKKIRNQLLLLVSFLMAAHTLTAQSPESDLEAEKEVSRNAKVACIVSGEKN
ncbi:MAG: hypothetical protein EPGJADBJ_03526 [Saprospiraceae bacterium]|nr:hypothetical protein [Saprospiraceae bacterium]